MNNIFNDVLEKIRPDKKEIEKIADISQKLKDKVGCILIVVMG